MEDAHVALLDVDHEVMPAPSRQDVGGGDGGGKIRMFGVFDGHGGAKERGAGGRERGSSTTFVCGMS